MRRRLSLRDFQSQAALTSDVAFTAEMIAACRRSGPSCRRFEARLLALLLGAFACTLAGAVLAGSAAAEARAHQSHDAGHVRAELRALGALSLPRQSGGFLGLGAGASVGVAWSTIPLTLGFELMGFRGLTVREDTRLAIDGALYPVTTRRTDHPFLFDLWLRMQPTFWFLRPYVEGFVGEQMLSTEYQIAFTHGEGTITLKDQRGWLKTIGWGLGVEINLGGTARSAALMLGFRQTYVDVARFTRTVRTERGDVPTERRVPLGSTLLTIGIELHSDFGGS